MEKRKHETSIMYETHRKHIEYNYQTMDIEKHDQKRSEITSVVFYDVRCD